MSEVKQAKETLQEIRSEMHAQSEHMKGEARNKLSDLSDYIDGIETQLDRFTKSTQTKLEEAQVDSRLALMEFKSSLEELQERYKKFYREQNIQGMKDEMELKTNLAKREAKDVWEDNISPMLNRINKSVGDMFKDL